MTLPIFPQPSAFVKNNSHSTKRGSTLITLIIFIMVMLTVASTSVSIIISNAQSTTGTGQSIEAYYAAEAGVENASLQLLRNPEYAGETLSLSSSSSVHISVSHNGHYEVISTGKSGSFTRIIQAKLDYTDNVLSVISWQELFQ